MLRALAAGAIAPPDRCMLCSDPAARIELHSEDYSEPFCFAPPAAYWLCIACHRNNLHKRFADPARWRAFLSHISRGGYARDLREPVVKREVASLTQELREGRQSFLPQLRPWVPRAKWWEHLSIDPATKTDIHSRPRP